jgi:hypothetical protein
MNDDLTQMRQIVQALARPTAGEKGKGALWRVVQATGLTPRMVKALIYPTDRTHVAATPDRLAAVKAAYRQHLEAEDERLDRERRVVAEQLRRLAENDNAAPVSARQGAS